jgi:hypothetical protein
MALFCSSAELGPAAKCGDRVVDVAVERRGPEALVAGPALDQEPPRKLMKLLLLFR